MAINVTQFGRVEFDPMKVPVAKLSIDEGARDGRGFERQLEAARAERPDEPQRAPAAPAEPVEAEPSVAATPPADARKPADPDPEPAGPARTVAATPAQPAHAAETPNTREGGAPASRQELSGKGAGAPPSHLPATSPLASTAGAATAQTAASIHPGATPAPIATTAAAAGAPEAVPGARSGTAHAAGRTTATAAAPGYRTLHSPTLQLAEANRDSIFRQIALRLTPDGGQMRVLIDPPQLGELEMKLEVHGNELRLAVVTERPEIALMLQKHLGDLRQHLAAQGMTIADAQVHSRDQQPSESAHSGGGHGHEFGGTSHDDRDEEVRTPRTLRGFITADGLDFWV